MIWIILKAFEFSMHFEKALYEVKMSDHLIFSLMNKANNFANIYRTSYFKNGELDY